MPNLIEIEMSVRKLNRLFSFIIIPVLGMLLPNLAGIITNNVYTWWQLAISYLYFVSIALLIWKGNVTFFRMIRKRYEQETLAYSRMISWFTMVNILYTAIITIIFLSTWQTLSNEGRYDWRPLLITGTAVITSAIIINSIYELVLLRKEMEKTIIKFKRMEIAKVQAELGALKAQIDPHFIFNSLNTLSYLIINKPETAKFYNETLAKVYRYILMNKDNDLVFLKDELEFISNYFYLVKIRFGDAVKMIVEIPESNAENFLITPISLQMLIENAIKHNECSRRTPLVITINIQSSFVSVRNRIKRKHFQGSSSGIGLKNLEERYQLIMKKNIIVQRSQQEFLVKIPILNA
jgi:sensor histidine kinase YesM